MELPSGQTRQTDAAVLLIALAAGLHLLPLVVPSALIDPDEGLHAAIAREMLERGDWVLPQFMGTQFLDKPILFFWALMASVAALGRSELAVRLPGVLFGFAGVVSTALLARTLMGGSALAPALFVAATLAAPFAMLLAPVHDVALVPFTTVALWAFWRREHDSASVGWVVVAGVALGLAILTKGLAGVALVGIAWGTYLACSRRLSWRAVADGTAALAIAALVATPWYLAVERRAPGYLFYFFVQRHFMGFTTTTQNHGAQPWWFYLPIVAAGSLPWTGWVWQSCWHGGSAPSSQSRGPNPQVFALSWLTSNVLFLSVAGSKLVT